MKILHAYGAAGASGGEYNWCNPGELVEVGLNATYMSKGFCGFDSLRYCTRAIVLEANDDFDLMDVWDGSRACANMHNIVSASCEDGTERDGLTCRRTEIEHLYRQAQRFPVGTVVRRTADGLDIEAVKVTVTGEGGEF